MTPGQAAWLGIAAGVFVYNAYAPDGHMLSQQVDQWLERHPVATRVAVELVARHLTNDLPERADPLAWLFLGARSVRAARAARRERYVVV